MLKINMKTFVIKFIDNSFQMKWEVIKTKKQQSYYDIKTLLQIEGYDVKKSTKLEKLMVNNILIAIWLISTISAPFLFNIWMFLGACTISYISSYKLYKRLYLK